MTTANPIAVREYLARVRTALADLPAGELDEVLDDVRPHLEEIAAELGEEARLPAMVARLGTPESYAAELRAAGDYPPPAAPAAATGPKPQRFGLRLAVWVVPLGVVVAAVAGMLTVEARQLEPLVVLLVPAAVALGLGAWYVSRRGTDAVAALPEVRWLQSAVTPGESGRGRVVRYLRSLEPAWWLLCAALFVLVAVLLVGGWDHPVTVVPVLGALAGLALWAGPRSKSERRWLWATVPLSAFVVGSLLGLFNEYVERVWLSDGHAYLAEDAYLPEPVPADAFHVGPPGAEALLYDDRQVLNVYAFDAAGKPLTEVYLYDQEGKPIDVVGHACARSGSSVEAVQDNKFPNPRVSVDGNDMNDPESSGPFELRDGEREDGVDCQQREGVPFTVAIPNVEAGDQATRKPAKPTSTTTKPR